MQLENESFFKQKCMYVPCDCPIVLLFLVDYYRVHVELVAVVEHLDRLQIVVLAHGMQVVEPENIQNDKNIVKC